MNGGLLNTVLSMLFPDDLTCEICGIEIFNGERLCAKCRKTVAFNDGKTCPVCGRKTQSNQLCFECKAEAPIYKKGVSALVYKDGAITLIHKFKNGNGYLKDYFAELLLPKCKKLKNADGVCYVPMTQSAQTDRGYNQSQLLAKALSERLELPLIDALTKEKETAEQKSLTRRERTKNLANCFKADKKSVKGKTLIVADDVLTTGATADAVAAALLKADAKAVYFAAVASVEYKQEI